VFERAFILWASGTIILLKFLTFHRRVKAPTGKMIFFGGLIYALN
jgi:hypothetical protein